MIIVKDKKQTTDLIIPESCNYVWILNWLVFSTVLYGLFFRQPFFNISENQAWNQTPIWHTDTMHPEPPMLFENLDFHLILKTSEKKHLITSLEIVLNITATIIFFDVNCIFREILVFSRISKCWRKKLCELVNHQDLRSLRKPLN